MLEQVARSRYVSLQTASGRAARFHYLPPQEALLIPQRLHFILPFHQFLPQHSLPFLKLVPHIDLPDHQPQLFIHHGVEVLEGQRVVFGLGSRAAWGNQQLALGHPELLLGLGLDRVFASVRGTVPAVRASGRGVAPLQMPSIRRHTSAVNIGWISLALF